MLPTRSRSRIGDCGVGARAVWADISKISTDVLLGFLWALMTT
jgi:hypothetical protein